MHLVKVRLKTGEAVSGPMVTWRPTQGWFVLAGVNSNRRIYLQDVASAEGLADNGKEMVNYLKRAQEDGWDGC